MKENVICGHLIPAGTGLREYDRLTVANAEEYKLQQEKEAEEPEEVVAVEIKEE